MASSPRQENRHLLWFIGVGLSLASFLYYPLTYHLSLPSVRTLYHNPPVEGFDRMAALFNILLLGGVGGVILFWTETLAPPLLRTVVRMLILFCSSFPVGQLFPWSLSPIKFAIKKGIFGGIVLIVVLVIIISILLRYENKIFPLLFRILFFLVPFAALTVVSLLVKLPLSSSTNTPPQKESPSFLRSNNPTDIHRVLWLVFDELDRILAFPTEEDPSPYFHLEALRTHSTAFSAAISPAYDTLESLPALIAGVPVQKAQPLKSSDLELTLTDGTKTTWHSLSSIFHDARQRRMKTILVGWHHPYSRVLSSILDECQWEPTSPMPFGKGGSLLVRQSEQLTWIGIPFPIRNRKLAVARYRRLFDKVLFHLREDFKANRSILMLAHLPIPHLPCIYDAERQQYSSWPRGKKESYRHNMVLVDKTIGEIRKTLEENGTWEDTLVILSSDHGMEDPSLGHRTTRVPFLVKLPRQQKGRHVTFPVNTVITRELIRTVLDGKVQTPEELEAWVKNYSVRSASTGVSRAARRAG